MLNYYPISLNLNHKLCIVIGGGRVGLRKINRLLASGAVVKVIAPIIKDQLKDSLEAHPHLSWIQADYSGPEDLRGGSLVFAATDKPRINQQILKDANALGIFVNVASQGDLSDFVVPASFNQGDLQVSVSTGGKVPGLSKAIKASLEEDLGPDYAILIDILADLRSLALRTKDQSQKIHHLSQLTNNYLSILQDISLGIDPKTISKRLLNLLDL